MPSQEDKNHSALNKDAESSAPADQAKAAGGSKKFLLFGGLGLVAVILGVAIAIFVIRPLRSGNDDAESRSTEVAHLKASGDNAKSAKSVSEHAKTKKKKKHGHGGESASLYTIKDIVINPAGTGGTRFLSVSFALELESAELEAEFETKEPVIRDALITILSSKTVAQLTDPKQKEIVRHQIKKRISELMKTDELAGVYYTDFVLQ